MAQTVNSGATAYATPDDFFARYDIRVIADWASDDGRRAGATDGVVVPATLAMNVRVLTCLRSGSGWVESIAFQGGRYDPATLRAIADSGTVTGELLKDLVCAIAISKLGRHRVTANQAVMLALQEAQIFLGQLLEGQAIFGTNESAGTANIQSHQVTQCEAYQRWGMSVQYEPYLGQPSDRTFNPFSFLGG